MSILRLILCGLFLWGGCAEAFQVPSRPCPGGVSEPGISYWADLKLDDNAASTTVVNAGTGGDFTAESNTSALHSAVTNDGSSGSFAVAYAQNNKRLISGAWNGSNKFEVSIDIKWVASTGGSNGNKVIRFDTDSNYGTIGPNEWFIERKASSADFKLYGQGSSGTYYLIETSGVSGDTNWHTYKITIDASTSPWSVSILIDGSAATLGSWTGSPGIANFNTGNTVVVVDSTYNYGIYGNYDNVKIKSN